MTARKNGKRRVRSSNIRTSTVPPAATITTTATPIASTLDSDSDPKPNRSTKYLPGKIPTALDAYIEDESTLFVGFQHHPVLKDSVTLNAAKSHRTNDVVEQPGDAEVNLGTAAFLFRELPYIKKKYNLSDDDSYSFFEYAVPLLTNNCTLGRLQSRMAVESIPTTSGTMKRAADAFEATFWYLSQVYPEERVASFVDSTFRQVIPCVVSDFCKALPSRDVNYYRDAVDRYHRTEYSQVSPIDERAFGDLLETKLDYLQPHLQALTKLLDVADESRIPVQFDDEHKVVGRSRLFKLLGHHIWKESLAVQCDGMFAWQRAFVEGGSGIRTDLCSLAACLPATEFLAHHLGFDRPNINPTSLASLFHIALAKIWVHDQHSLREPLRQLSYRMIDYSEKTLILEERKRHGQRP
ncbi:hypothetical protein ONZ45_g1255 [Pleurotus djamor]|nr:hypothetical protein ONZ45_g1255 [Pleurotus djamor]